MLFDQRSQEIVGAHGTLPVGEKDEVALKLAMLIEGECEGLGPSRAARKYGYTKQRYFQLLHAYRGTRLDGAVEQGPRTEAKLPSHR